MSTCGGITTGSLLPHHGLALVDGGVLQEEEGLLFPGHVALVDDGVVLEEEEGLLVPGHVSALVHLQSASYRFPLPSCLC